LIEFGNKNCERGIKLSGKHCIIGRKIWR